MATYTGSPFGTIRGKLGNTVATKWKGINVIRSNFSPTNPNSLKQQAVKQGYRVIQKLGSRHFSNNVRPIWNVLAKRSGLPLTGLNLLLKKSARLLYKHTQAGILEPDWASLQVSDGILEPTDQVNAFAYTPASGLVTIDWDNEIYRNGNALDNVSVLIFRAPYDAHPEGNSWLLGTSATRGNASATLYTAKNLPSMDLTAFIYFSNGSNYSASFGRLLAQPRDTIIEEEEAITFDLAAGYEKITEYKILRRDWVDAYRLFAKIQNCQLFFRLKSIAEGDLDSDVVNEDDGFSRYRQPVLPVTAQNEYVSLELWAQNAGSGESRVENFQLYAYAF
jgi:hypothetical protein